MFVPPSTALAGKIYNTLMSQVTAGKKHGGMNEVDGVRFDLKKSEIASLEKLGLVPMVKEYGKVIAVGTGGNISKIFELAKSKPGKAISLKKVKQIRDMVESFSIDGRIYKLQMNPDRADVIIPASNIYIQVMEWAHAGTILVPEVGLKDGMMMYLYEKNTKQTKIEFN